MLDDVFSKEFLFLTFSLLALCYVVRLGVETALPSLSKATPLTTGQRVWEKFILKVMPIVFGAGICAALPSYPYPEGIKTLGARLVYGVFCGYVSQWVYDLGKALIYKRWQIDPPQPPSPPPGDASS